MLKKPARRAGQQRRNVRGPGATLNVTGLLTNEASGTLNVQTGLVTAGGGGLTNLGYGQHVRAAARLTRRFLNNGGTINIDGTSKLVVGSGGVAGQGYTQFANGTLGEIIITSSFGVINVTGAANLAGTLNILLQNGYDPANGTMIKFLNFTPGELNGTFASILNQTFNNGTQMWTLDSNNALGFYELVARGRLGRHGLLARRNRQLEQRGQWSPGNPPTPTDDVVIYSGVADDLVTWISAAPPSPRSLWAAAPNTYTSELTDGGMKQTLTITNGLTIGRPAPESLRRQHHQHGRPHQRGKYPACQRLDAGDHRQPGPIPIPER